MNKNYWCGIRGVYQIWHGQWADPEVRYKNYICNEWDLQESMYITMKDRIADGEDWGDPDNDRDFMNFCKQNADLVKQDIMELSTGGVYESKNIMLRKDKALLESMGADLIHRTDDRFFGDKFGRSRELKTTISKSIMKLKKLKEEFTIEEYDMLKRLIDNPQKRYDARSYVEIRKRDSYPFVYVNFVLTSNNFPKAIINKLNNVKKNINDVKECGISVEKNGITKTVNIQISWVQDYPEEYEYVFKEYMSKEIGIEVIKYVLHTIKPIFEDILNWSKTNESASEIMLRKDKALLESLTKRYGKKNILNKINENKQEEIASLYKREIFNYLDSLKWDNLYDIIYEFGYGDEYYELVDDIMDALGLDEMEEHYDYLYPYMERIIREYLIKNKMWR